MFDLSWENFENCSDTKDHVFGYENGLEHGCKLIKENQDVKKVKSEEERGKKLLTPPQIKHTW